MKQPTGTSSNTIMLPKGEFVLSGNINTEPGLIIKLPPSVFEYSKDYTSTLFGVKSKEPLEDRLAKYFRSTLRH